MGTERINRRFVEAGHRAEWARDEVKLVLDNQVGRGQGLMEHLAALRLGRGVEAARIVTVGTAQQRPAGSDPGQRRELIHGGDQEGGQATVDRLIHRDDRQWAVAAEVTRNVATDDAEFAGCIGVGTQAKRVRREAGVAPRAVFQRDRCGAALRVFFVANNQRTRRILAFVALLAHRVGRGSLAHPQANLKGPGAVALRCLLPLQFQRTDQAGRTGQLIERQQAQGIAHDHAHPGPGFPLVAGVTDAAQDDGERSQSQVRFGFAAAGGEEEQIYAGSIRVVRVSQTGQVEQDEG